MVNGDYDWEKEADTLENFPVIILIVFSIYKLNSGPR